MAAVQPEPWLRALITTTNRELENVIVYAAAIYWRKLNRDERRYTFVADFDVVFVQL
jgi:hypothetical protein